MALDNVEGVLYVAVTMPGHLLCRRDLEFADAEAGPLSMEIRRSLHEMTRSFIDSMVFSIGLCRGVLAGDLTRQLYWILITGIQSR